MKNSDLEALAGTYTVDLESFANIYVGSFLEMADSRSPIELGKFYDTVFQRVSERTGLSAENVKYLHHAFHWTFFEHQAQSTFQIIPAEKQEWSQRISLQGTLPKKSDIVSRAIEKYGTWLEARIKKLPVD